MECHEFEHNLQDWLDGDLNDERVARLEIHAESCSDCRSKARQFRVLRAALTDLPAPKLSARQMDRLLSRAPRRKWPVLATATAAAALMAALVLPFADWSHTTATNGNTMAAAEIDVPLNQTRTVRLALSSRRDLTDATVVLELPAGVDLEGLPARRILSWQTDISAGENRLSLPLIAHEPGVRELVARIEHEGKSREMRIRLNTHEGEISMRTRENFRV